MLEYRNIGMHKYCSIGMLKKYNIWMLEFWKNSVLPQLPRMKAAEEPPPLSSSTNVGLWKQV